MTKIFISYRRQDTKLIVGRIFDRLKEKFGRDGVFMDIDSIPFGVDFRAHLDREVSGASAVLVLIGHGWVDARDEHGRRLDNPDDFVRIEIESALKRDIPVGAVLVDGAPMPRSEQLPESMRPLLARNAAQLDAVRDFDAHMARLIAELERHVSDLKTDDGRSVGRIIEPKLREKDPTKVEGPTQNRHHFEKYENQLRKRNRTFIYVVGGTALGALLFLGIALIIRGITGDNIGNHLGGPERLFSIWIVFGLLGGGIGRHIERITCK